MIQIEAEFSDPAHVAEVIRLALAGAEASVNPADDISAESKAPSNPVEKLEVAPSKPLETQTAPVVRKNRITGVQPEREDVKRNFPSSPQQPASTGTPAPEDGSTSGKILELLAKRPLSSGELHIEISRIKPGFQIATVYQSAHYLKDKGRIETFLDTENDGVRRWRLRA